MATKVTAEQKYLRNLLATGTDAGKIAASYKKRYGIDLPLDALSAAIKSPDKNAAVQSLFTTATTPPEVKQAQDRAKFLTDSYQSIGNKSAGVQNLSQQYADYAKQYGENSPITKAFAESVYSKLPDLGTFGYKDDNNPITFDYGMFKGDTNLGQQFQQQEQAARQAEQAAEAERDRQKAAARESLVNQDVSELLKSGNLYFNNRESPNAAPSYAAFSSDAMRQKILQDLAPYGYSPDSTWVGQENLLGDLGTYINALSEDVYAKSPLTGEYVKVGQAFANPGSVTSGQRSRWYTGAVDNEGNPLTGHDLGNNLLLYDIANPTQQISHGYQWSEGADNPLGDLAPLVSIGLGLAGVPGMIGSALGATGSLATAVGSGVIGAGTSLLGGGDVGDALKAGLLAGGGSYVGNQLFGGSDPAALQQAANQYGWSDAASLGTATPNLDIGGLASALPLDQVSALPPSQDLGSGIKVNWQTPSGDLSSFPNQPSTGISIDNMALDSMGGGQGVVGSIPGLGEVTSAGMIIPAAGGAAAGVPGALLGGTAGLGLVNATAPAAGSFNIKSFLTDTFGVSPETAGSVSAGLDKLGTAITNDPFKAASLAMTAGGLLQNKINPPQEETYTPTPVDRSIVDKYGKVPSLGQVNYQPLQYQGFQNLGVNQGLLNSRLNQMKGLI